MKKLLGILLGLLFFVSPAAFADELTPKEVPYQVNVSLWHAHEDKLSMGSAGLSQRAELIKEETGYTLYLQMKPITVASLTTSVKRFFIYQESNKTYLRGLPACYDITLSGKAGKCPSIFILPLDEKRPFYSVLVDPDVPQMGSDPIKARLKIDWETLEEIKDAPLLISRAKDSQGDMAIKEKMTYQKEGVILKDAPYGELDFGLLQKKDLLALGLKLDALDTVKGYHIGLAKPIEAIPEDKLREINQLSEPIDLKNEVSLIFSDTSADEIWQQSGQAFKKVTSQKCPEGLLVRTKTLGTFAVIHKHQMASSTFVAKNTPKPLKAKPGLKKKVQGIKKVDKVSRQAVQKKALGLKTEPTSESQAPEQVAPKERYGVIFLVMFFYLMLFLLGVIFWKKAYPKLKEEFERARYIEAFREKGERT